MLGISRPTIAIIILANRILRSFLRSRAMRLVSATRFKAIQYLPALGLTIGSKSILNCDMQKSILLVFATMICGAVFAENVRFNQFGTHIPARPDLEVRWNPPTDSLPSQIWVYHLLPRKPSAEMISYLKSLCSFTEDDRIDSSANGMMFRTPDNSRHLWISSAGDVYYESLIHYGLTNLIEAVPDEGQALKRVKQILPKFGISLSDIDRKDDSNEPWFICFDSQS